VTQHSSIFLLLKGGISFRGEGGPGLSRCIQTRKGAFPYPNREGNSPQTKSTTEEAGLPILLVKKDRWAVIARGKGGASLLRSAQKTPSFHVPMGGKGKNLQHLDQEKSRRMRRRSAPDSTNSDERKGSAAPFLRCLGQLFTDRSRCPLTAKFS